MNTFNLKLDVDKAAKGMRNQVVRIRKGDLNGTILVAELYDHGTKITTSGLTVDFVMLQPDREHYYRATATWSATNGTASVTLDESYAGSVAGDTDVAYFELRQGTQVIASTENFRISVLRSATDEGETPAESYDDIIPAAVYAWLEEHPEATTTVQDDSLTTPKYKDHSVTDPKLSRVGFLGNVLRGTGSGAVVTATDAYAAPPLGLVVDGKSTQDGTPTPSSPVAIDSVESVSAVLATANLLDLSLYVNDINISGSTVTNKIVDSRTDFRLSMQCYTASGTSLGNVAIQTLSSAGIVSQTVALPNGTAQAILKHNGSTRDVRISRIDFPPSTTSCHVSMTVTKANASTVDGIEFSNGMVTVDGATPEYRPYAKQTVPIDLQGHELRSLPDGTHDELVVDADGNVTLVQRVGEVTLDGNETWYKSTVSGHSVAHVNLSGLNIDVPMFVQNGVTGASSHYPVVSYSASTLQDNNMGIAPSAFSGTKKIVIADDAHATSVDAFKSWLAQNNVTVLYPLATPVTHDLGTISLPDTPAPDLTAWAVTDPSTTIELTYERDANVAYDEMRANIAPIEQAVATANHAAGSLMMLGGRLVKATTAIAIGESVAIGNNVAATSVAAELALKANA